MFGEAGQLSAHQLIKLCAPLLKSLKASYKKQNKTFNMQEVICFPISDCVYGAIGQCASGNIGDHRRDYPRKLNSWPVPRCDCRCENLERVHGDFVSGFRALAAMLDAEDDGAAQEGEKRQLRSRKKSAVAE